MLCKTVLQNCAICLQYPHSATVREPGEREISSLPSPSVNFRILEEEIEYSSKQLCSFYLSGKCRFGSQCRDIHQEAASPFSGTTRSKKMDSSDAGECASKKTKKKIKKEKPKEEESVEKKPSMKTASDVISRLLWDESLPKRKFVVGYLDRFVGIVEKPFTALDWNDPAVVDNYTLALPKHRIQYFKYRNRKVWDKNSRTDIIFGSTGSGFSIYEFMEQVDSNKAGFFDENIMIPQEFRVPDDDSSDEEEKYPPPDASDRPNFFIAARIVDPETAANLAKVTDYIREKDSVLAECCSTSETFHLTLAILKLDTSSAVNDAIQALEALKTSVVPKVTINLDTLDVFKHRVLFACVPDDDDLQTLRDLIVKELSDRNLDMKDRHSFVPHVTLAKISRTAFKARHSNYIDQYLYLQFEDDYFGSQFIDTLYLCEMTTQRREDGFYMCSAEVKLH